MTRSAAEQLRCILADMSRWWREQLGNRRALNEWRDCPCEDWRHAASDLGTTPAELRTLAARWPGSADLLSRRVAALGLDLETITHRLPATANDLKRLCSLCRNKGECEHDLDSAPGDPRWREYCPNAPALASLRRRSPLAPNAEAAQSRG
jgi:hypothetical protein